MQDVSGFSTVPVTNLLAWAGVSELVQDASFTLLRLNLLAHVLMVLTSQFSVYPAPTVDADAIAKRATLDALASIRPIPVPLKVAEFVADRAGLMRESVSLFATLVALKPVNIARFGLT